MVSARPTEFCGRISREDWDLKLYRIEATKGNTSRAWEKYDQGIETLVPESLARKPLKDPSCPRVGFIICHEGRSIGYLVLCVWGNDNELFTDVRVWLNGVWTVSSDYSFCLYDMEVMWFERNAFIETLYSGETNRELYLSKHYASSDAQVKG